MIGRRRQAEIDQYQAEQARRKAEQEAEQARQKAEYQAKLAREQEQAAQKRKELVTKLLAMSPDEHMRVAANITARGESDSDRLTAHNTSIMNHLLWAVAKKLSA